jgi:hypothetical protein
MGYYNFSVSLKIIYGNKLIINGTFKTKS